MRKYVNPARLFKADEELTKRLIGFLSAALYTEDCRLIAKLFHEKFYPMRQKLPRSIAALFLLEKILPAMLAKVIFTSVNIFAGMFVAGNGFKSIIKKADAYGRKGFLVNFDILGEAVLSEAEAERYQSAYMDFISEIGPKLPFNALSISLKGSAFYSQINSCAPARSAQKISERLMPIMETIACYGGHAYLDAEEYEFREIHFLVFEKMYKKFGSSVRHVLQSYLITAEDTLNRLAAINNSEDPIWIRIVRGAYWDGECYNAELAGRPEPPVFSSKNQTDDNYKRMVQKGRSLGFNVVPATHNIASIIFAEENSRASGRPIAEFQLLYGIGESIGRLLAEKKIPVRFYMPVQYPRGRLREAGGYLIRRINESQLSFVVRGLADIADEDKNLLNKIPGRPR